MKLIQDSKRRFEKTRQPRHSKGKETYGHPLEKTEQRRLPALHLQDELVEQTQPCIMTPAPPLAQRTRKQVPFISSASSVRLLFSCTGVTREIRLNSVKTALLALALVPTAFAQNILYGPLVSGVTHSTARFTFVTDAKPDTAAIELTSTRGSRTLAATHSPTAPFTSFAVVTGLTPATTYHVRARLNDGASPSNEITFTTPREPQFHPAPPAEPEPVDTAMPTGPYGEPIAIAEDCSNLPDVLTHLAELTGELNYEIVIPAGAECVGRFRFPPRPNHTGWVIVRSSAVGTQAFPPEGVRWTPEWQGSTARFVTNILPVFNYNQPHFVPEAPCDDANGPGEGGYFWTAFVDRSTFPLLRCSNNYAPYEGPSEITAITGNGTMAITAPGHQLKPGDLIRLSENGYAPAGTQTMVAKVDGDTFTVYPLYRPTLDSAFNPDLQPTFTRNRYWQSLAHTEGEALPESCEVRDWFFNPGTGAAYWCVTPNQWRSFTGDFPRYDRHAAIVVPAGAARYRFIGIEVTHQPLPNPLPEGWENPINGRAYQGTVLELAESHGDHVIWDRSYIHGHPYPQRLSFGLSWSGDHIAVVNSYLDELAWWRKDGLSQTECAIGIIHWSGGPALFDNNYLAAAGMGYFVPESGATPPHDVTFSRNNLRVYPKWRGGDPENNGMTYTNRNSWELKQGAVHKVEGNTFDTNFSNLTIGAFLVLTPRCATAVAPLDIASANDGVVTTNTAGNYRPGDILVITDTGSAYDGLWEVASTGCPENCTRLTLKDGPSGSLENKGRLYLEARNAGIRDIRFRYNTAIHGTEFLRLVGTDTSCSWSMIPPTLRVDVRDNHVDDLNVRSFDNGGYVDKNGIYGAYGFYGPRLVNNGGSVEDLTVRDNWFTGNRGNQPFLLYTDGVNEGLDFSSNVFTFDEHRAFTGVAWGANTYGVDALNRGYTRDGKANWRFSNNLLCCGLKANSAGYPDDTRWAESIDSAALPRRSDGALLAALQPEQLPRFLTFEQELAGRQGRVLDVRVEGTTLSYLAPDSQSCAVELGPSAAFGTGRRLSDGGGARSRTVTLTDLPPQSTLHYRILCAAEQPSGTIRTK